MPIFRHRGARVVIPRGGEVSQEFFPNGEYASSVQVAIDGLGEFSPRKISVATVDSIYQINVRILENRGNTPLWGVHSHHTASQPGDSPFLMSELPFTTSSITVEMTASDRGPGPLLVRAYPGEYMPPLPWQRTVRLGIGGYEASLRFWRTHSYLWLPGLTDELSTTPPDWYVQAS